MHSDLVLGSVFLIQMAVGILGNFFLLSLFTFTFLTGHKLRTIECLFAHLALANSKVLLSKGIPLMIICLGVKNFLGPFGCKLIVYLYNIARSVSLNITCLLSGFQVITISPSNSRWAELKTQAPKYIVPSCFFCWCFSLLVNFTLLGTMHKARYMTNDTRMWYLGYCSMFSPISFNVSLFAIVFSIPDIICVGFMIWANAFLVLLLHRHHQQVQHIHSSHLSPRTFPEKRATRGILLLVSIYASFYSINSGLSFYLFKSDKSNQWILAISDLMAAWFPAISPFVLIFCDSQILKYWDALWHRTPFYLLCHIKSIYTPSQNSALSK
ncbi:vomeronasal type-1 receptor 4-like [Sarcophilus harrisii]|uniref:Vomeronasal type-1 receptor n=1 Tax=Sarcophilus harrisii TaxID=9305 RepID=A0A7N4PQQ1_SARHA|nr:vomeronasal type-1 receptor 4-like [Sarcophilus harrisii]